MSDVTVSPRRPRRWPLYASLFLNVVLITVIAIGAWDVMKFRERVALGVGPWLPRQIERALPDEAKEKVRPIFDANRDGFRELFRSARRSHEAVRTALEAEPFSPDALREALQAKTQAELALSNKSADIVLEIVSVLTPEERKQVRDAIREHKPRKGKDRDRDGEQGPPPPPPPPEHAL